MRLEYIGPYKVIKTLYEGEYTDVLLVENSKEGPCALKMLVREKYRERFIEEIKIMKKLKHDGIISLLYIGDYDSKPYITMKYVYNGNIGEIYPNMRIPTEMVPLYVRQVSDALQYAHDQNIVHGDIKPQNVLLDEGEHLLLTDFSAAQVLQPHPSHRRTTQQILAATWEYAAPEQFDEDEVSKESDQYSLAVMVYEWLCGELPFDGKDRRNLRRQHRFEPVPPFKKKGIIDVPKGVEQVIQNALAKKPEKRFESVDRFAHAFEQAWLAPDQASLLFQVRRRPVLIGLCAAGLTFVAGGTIWYVVHQLISTVSPTTPLGTILFSYNWQGGASVTAVAWSPDGKFIASAALDSTVQVLNAANGGHIYTYRGHAGYHAVAWSPNGKRIASGGEDKTVQVWDATSGEHISIYRGHSGNVNTVVWSPNGKWIASGAGIDAANGNISPDYTVQVWNATTGDTLFRYSRHTGGVNVIAWSPNGKWIASGSDDKTVQVWDATSGSVVYTYREHTNSVVTLAWFPNSTRIISGDKKTMRAWDAANGMNVSTYSGDLSSAAWLALSPNGQRIATYPAVEHPPGVVQLWNASDGEYIYTFRDNTFRNISQIAWSPEGKRLAQVGRGTVLVWAAD